MNSENNQSLLSAKEVAERLHITLRSAYTLLHGGKLPGKKIGKNWYIHSADFERLLRSSGYETPESISGHQPHHSTLDATGLRESLAVAESGLERLTEAFRATNLLFSPISSGVEAIYPPRRASSETNDAIAKLISEASGEILLCGIALRQFFHDKPFRKVLWQKLTDDRSLHLRALLLDPSSRSAMARAFAEEPSQEKGHRPNPIAWLRQTILYQDIMRSIVTIRRFQDEFGSERLQARFYDHNPFAFFLIAPNAMIIEQYHFGQEDALVGGCIGELVPTLRVSTGCDFYRVVMNSFNHIWSGDNPFVGTKAMEEILSSTGQQSRTRSRGAPQLRKAKRMAV
jgi:excisionase family DNA binding protein